MNGLLSISLSLIVTIVASASTAQPPLDIRSAPLVVDEGGQQLSQPVAGFDALLEKYVVDGYVNYRGFANSPAFDRYIQYVAQKDISDKTGSDEKLAFYLNAYNALAIKGILDGGSPSSFLKKIHYFYLSHYVIAGKRMNLYDFEHKVIRKLGEPRIHFALVCASYSCPKLKSEVYSYNADKLDEQLSESAVDFINDPGKNSFDVTGRYANLSKIFDWFVEDFTQYSTLQEYIAEYVIDESVQTMLDDNLFDIRFKKYDWSLNGLR